MKVQMIEQPFPWDEPAPAPGYFAPPSNLVVGNEWRLIQGLRDAAASGNAVTILTDAVVTQVQQALVPSPQGLGLGLGMAFADLAVTGRRAFGDFASKVPREGGPIEAAAMAKFTALGTSGVTPALISKATSEVLDRAYQVAWFLRAQTARGDLGWIAVSGEDDLPHRPVNVPRTAFPQHDLFFTVPGDLGEVVVQTRYAIATAADPVATTVSLPQRSLPPVLEPTLPEHDRIILFINGSDSRLEEATELISKLVRLPDGRPSGFAVIAMDLPGSGYVNPIDHTEVRPWTPPPAVDIPVLGPVDYGPVAIALLPFLEKFILRFVATLSTRLGQPGLVESRIAAVVGGSLGGNLALRLARQRAPWLRNAVAWSPGSVWQAGIPDPKLVNPVWAYDFPLLQAGVALTIPKVGEPEDGASRDSFFAGAFDQRIPSKTQPEQWYRDDFPAKQQYITSARLDRRETYTPQFRRWHWRVSLEELVWSWQNPAVQDFRSRVLLGAGSADDIPPARIFTNTRILAAALANTDGDTFFFDRTGHSIHAERTEALAGKIRAFLEEPAELARPVPAIWELLLLEESVPPVELAPPVPAIWELLLS
jgi:pimeloyl-ACP methyl ester carboxylesterase